MAHGPDTDELMRRIRSCNNKLDLTGLNITRLPTLPSRLKRLDCSNTPLTTLPTLPSGLKSLDCSNTPLILQRGANESIRDYNARWNEWRELEMSMKRCQERSRIIYEDLCAASWRPERVQKWIEIGGLDILDVL